MKHTRLYSCLLAVVMLVMASATALAQEFAYTAKSATFLKSGEKGTVSVSFSNSEKVRILEGKIKLPAELSFVVKNAEKGYLAISSTDRTKDATLFLKSIDEHNAMFLVSTTPKGIAAGNGDIFTFDVNATSNIAIAQNIEFSGLNISVAADKPVATANNFTATVCNDAFKLLPSVSPITVQKGVEQKVSFAMAFEPKVLSGLQFDLVMPEGLSVVEDSYEVTSRCPNHIAQLVKGHFTVLVKDITESRNFNGKDGDVCSFKVVANEKFVDGSEILFKNIKAVSSDEMGNTKYYGGDLAVKVTLDTTTGINGINADEFGEGADGIYQLNGVRTDKLQRGVNIVVKNGKAVKVVKK